VRSGSSGVLSLWNAWAFLVISKQINKLVYKKQGDIHMKDVDKLIKSLTTLSNLILLYLTITWGYQGLAFLIGSLIN